MSEKRKKRIRGTYFKDTTGMWNFEVETGRFLYEGIQDAFYFFKRIATGERKKGVMVWFMGQIYPIFPGDTPDEVTARININNSVLKTGIPLNGELQKGFHGLQRLCEDPVGMNVGWNQLQQGLVEEAH